MKLIPSFPIAVKRRFDIEREGWDAHVKVDYDEKHIPMLRVRRAAVFFSRRSLKVLRAEVSETRKGYHLRVWLDRDIGPYTALLAQEILGDDPIRQMFNRKRVRKKRPGWNVLFNEKWRGQTCVMKEKLDVSASRVVRKILKGSIKKGTLYCKHPDPFVPRLVCGWPLPCPRNAEA